MPEVPQHPFLEALGWTLLNSWWQFGILWLGFLFFKTVLPIRSAAGRYNLAGLLLVLGFLCSILTFLYFGRNPAEGLARYRFQHNGWNYLLQTSYYYLSTWLPSITLAYLGWILLKGIGLCRALRQNGQLRSQGLSRAPVSWRLYLREMSGHLNISCHVDIRLSHLVDTPVVTGWLKPLILMPVSLVNQLSTEQVEAILLHELAHIKRNDYFWNLLLSVAAILYGYNPFARKLLATLREEREHACDDLVLQFPFPPHQYAIALLKLEQKRTTDAGLLLAASGSHQKLLLTRVHRMLGMQARKETHTPSFYISISSLALLLASFFLSPGEVRQPLPEAGTKQALAVSTTRLVSRAPVEPATTPASPITVTPVKTIKPAKSDNAIKPEAHASLPAPLATSTTPRVTGTNPIAATQPIAGPVADSSTTFTTLAVAVNLSPENAPPTTSLLSGAVASSTLEYTWEPANSRVLAPVVYSWGTRLPYIPKNSFEVYEQLDSASLADRVNQTRNIRIPGRIVHF